MSDPELDRILAGKARRLAAEASNRSSAGPMELTEANFDGIVKSERPTFVDFWAVWCGPCRTMEPVVERLTAKYSGRVTFGKLNVDEQSNIATRYDVLSIPTFMLFKRGLPVDVVIGAVAESVLEQSIRRVAGD